VQHTTLGRTDLQVSVAGLGCGGYSRLGQAYGRSTAESEALIDAALDMGVNFIDTAPAYGTESIVGRALRGRREAAIVSTKALIHLNTEYPPKPSRFITAAELQARLDESLKALGMDYVDVYNLHGVVESELDYVDAELVPKLVELKTSGKIRSLGITEHFQIDTQHAMLSRAVRSGVWDVVMAGFNLLNPCARQSVLKPARELNVGVLNMHAVRTSLSNPDRLLEALETAADAGQLGRSPTETAAALDELVAASGAASLTGLAYRFCRHEPGVHVVLTGTGKLEHLRANVAAIDGDPVPEQALAGLEALFGSVDCLSGE
jgi:L-galactose dehydrogenase